MSFIIILSQCSSFESQEDQVRKKRLLKKRALAKLNIHSALPGEVKDPDNNLSSPEKVVLGKLLFYDPILSGDKDVACATCHHPSTGYAEYRDISIGVNGVGFGSRRHFKAPNKIPFVKRNANTILNTAYNGISTSNRYDPENAPMFWDLRVNSLEKQAVEPILALEEMRGLNYEKPEILLEVVNRLKNIPEYVSLFKEAFDETEPISEQNIGKAIAAFERTLVTADTRFDQYMRGDEDAISLSEKDGFNSFKEAGCGNCHNGPMFSDFKPHTLGVPENPKLPAFDMGMDSTYAFRTPSLRNLRFTAPYMHNGRFQTLKEVLEFYEDIANGKMRHEVLVEDQLDTLVNEIELSVREMAPIISFLNTLNETNFDKEIPASVPSGLPVGGNIN